MPKRGHVRLCFESAQFWQLRRRLLLEGIKKERRLIRAAFIVPYRDWVLCFSYQPKHIILPVT